MRSNIETIKFTGKFSLITAVMAYIVSLNIELGFFQPNWSWISNNFALTVCGGAFSSFLVVMLCEVQKYRSNKLSCENFLFTQTMYLYMSLYLMNKNIDEYIRNQNEPIPGNLIDEGMMMIRSQSAAIRNVDYITFRKNNNQVIAYRNFCSNELVSIESIISSGNYLKMAVIQTQIKNLKETCSQGTITSSDELVNRTLATISNQLSPVLEDVSTYLETIDHNCNGRYNWNIQRTKIHESYASPFRTERFEDFLKSTEAKS